MCICGMIGFSVEQLFFYKRTQFVVTILQRKKGNFYKQNRELCAVSAAIAYIAKKQTILRCHSRLLFGKVYIFIKKNDMDKTRICHYDFKYQQKRQHRTGTMLIDFCYAANVEISIFTML